MARPSRTTPSWTTFIASVAYHAMNFDDHDGYGKLNPLRGESDQKRGAKDNRLFYLATAPEYFSETIQQPGAQGVAHARERNGVIDH